MKRNNNTLIKVTTDQSSYTGRSVQSLSIYGKSEIYELSNRGSIYIPFQQYLLYRNGNELAEIDLQPLLNYPSNEHHLNIKTYNEILPFSDSPEIKIIINFVHSNLGNQNMVPIQITFIDAQLTHDTDLIGKMDPYIKVLVDGVEKWRSKIIKNGDKHPNFDKQFVNLSLKSIEDSIRIQILEQDLTTDDFVGGCQLKPYQLIGKNNQILSYTITYNKNNNIINAGIIRFQVTLPEYL